MGTSLFHIAIFSAAGFLFVPSTPLQTPTTPKLAFPDASPAAKFEQRVGVTDILVSYARPGVKGRTIFDSLEPYGQVWRTGANAATTITFSTDVKFGGAAVPAGKYTLFSIPDEKEWTVILNKKTGQWGAYSYDEQEDLVRVKAKPIALPAPVETFTIGLSDLRDDSATFYFEWERVRVPVKIETDLVKTLVPQIEQAMAGSGEKPYLAAAMFYYEHDLDLKQAAAWMDEFLKAQPDAIWALYRKGMILAKLGDKPGAIAVATRSMELAAQSGGVLGDEYTRLNKALIARCR